MSDLKDNTTRGFVAEYLVGRAVGSVEDVRAVWGNFDVVSAEGIRIQVKASAFLQAWRQRSTTRIAFRGLRGRAWSDDEGYQGEAEYRGDVFVFCVQTATRHEAYDALDVDQWEFYCVPQSVLAERGLQSIALAALKRIADGPHSFEELHRAVKRAYERQLRTPVGG